jgi:hypothetical protein
VEECPAEAYACVVLRGRMKNAYLPSGCETPVGLRPVEAARTSALKWEQSGLPPELRLITYGWIPADVAPIDWIDKGSRSRWMCGFVDSTPPGTCVASGNRSWPTSVMTRPKTESLESEEFLVRMGVFDSNLSSPSDGVGKALTPCAPAAHPLNRHPAAVCLASLSPGSRGDG